MLAQTNGPAAQAISGSLDGIALKPLTVDFHEVGFGATLNGENGQPFWFQMSDQQRQKAGSPWGPANPQALNRYSYVLNGPMRWTDPSGHVTFSVGFTVRGGLLWVPSGSISGGITWDTSGNIKTYSTVTVGGTLGAVAGASVGATITGAPTIQDTAGEGGQIGGDGGFLGKGGVDFVGGKDLNGKAFYGFSPSIGLGLGADVHFEHSDTKLADLNFHPIQALKDIYNEGEQKLRQYATPTGYGL